MHTTISCQSRNPRDPNLSITSAARTFSPHDHHASSYFPSPQRLYNNSFTGTIPTQLGKLDRMESKMVSQGGRQGKHPKRNTTSSLGVDRAPHAGSL